MVGRISKLSSELIDEGFGLPYEACHESHACMAGGSGGAPPNAHRLPLWGPPGGG